MPASRSRTERWRECLQQILERGGTLEISLERGASAHGSPDLVWRVHLLEIRPDALVVERPVAMGRPVDLEAGTPLVVAMSIGQNRWMFHSQVSSVDASDERRAPALRIEAPTRVERCQRRSFFRISTAELRLPVVECWPLLDPTTVVAAEVANRAQLAEATRDPAAYRGDLAPDSIVLPEVGPGFRARLLNIGGGGAGLLVDASDASALDRSRLMWMRVDLRPELPAPIGLTARIAHSRMDSTQNVTVGVAFDFAFNAAHKEFVVEQICRFVAEAQARLSDAA